MQETQLDWFVVHTRPGCECRAAARLACELCLQVYVPQVLQRQDSVLVAVPLFPGYFFVAGPQGEQAPGPELDAISCTPGCGVVVRPATNSGPHGAAGRGPGGDPRLSPPATLAPPVIAWLRCRVAAIDAAGGLPFQLLAAAPPGAIAAEGIDPTDATGAAIAVLDAATSGLYPAAVRVAALLRLIGCGSDCAPAASEPTLPAARRRRRTRGHGRWIHYR